MASAAGVAGVRGGVDERLGDFALVAMVAASQLGLEIRDRKYTLDIDR